MDPEKVTAIDVHTAGEPLRIITGGWPDPPGKTMLEKRRAALEKHDHFRTGLMWEPRGHADMYGCLITEPVTPDGDIGVLFLHNEGYSTMCGHGIIGLVKAGLERKLFTPSSPTEVRIDTPAGRVTAFPEWDGNRIDRVSFINVPSFVLKRDLAVQIPGADRIQCDIVFGGAFYAVVSVDNRGLRLVPEESKELIERGRMITAEVGNQFPIEHPEGNTDLNFLYGTIFVGKAQGDAHSRNVCIFADGEVDRSPTGTGVSGRAALHYARKEMTLKQTLLIESILGTTFEVSIEKETKTGVFPAILPRVTGSAHITGTHEFTFEPSDPLRRGFFLR